MEKRVIYGITFVLIYTTVVVIFGPSTSLIANIAWVLSQYFGEIVAISLIWYLFTEKLIRVMLVPVIGYYILDFIMTCLFYIDVNLYTLINEQMGYILEGILFLFALTSIITQNVRMTKTESSNDSN